MCRCSTKLPRRSGAFPRPAPPRSWLPCAHAAFSQGKAASGWCFYLLLFALTGVKLMSFNFSANPLAAILSLCFSCAPLFHLLLLVFFNCVVSSACCGFWVFFFWFFFCTVKGAAKKHLWTLRLIHLSSLSSLNILNTPGVHRLFQYISPCHSIALQALNVVVSPLLACSPAASTAIRPGSSLSSR